MDGTVVIENENTVTNSDGVAIVMGRNMELEIKDANGAVKASYRLQYGSKLLVKNGAKVKAGATLSDWDPYTMPVIVEKDGIANYADLVEGTSLSEQVDDATGIASKVVTDWRSTPKGGDLKPRISLMSDKGEAITLSNGLPANYYLSTGAVLSIENGSTVKAGDVIARIPRESSKTRDITGGLPRVAELFEARRPKDFAVISEIDGYIEFGKDYKAKRRIVVNPTDESMEASEYMIPKGRPSGRCQKVTLSVRVIQLLDGALVPHDILDVMGVEALADYLVNEIQDVYRLQRGENR